MKHTDKELWLRDVAATDADADEAATGEMSVNRCDRLCVEDDLCELFILTNGAETDSVCRLYRRGCGLDWATMLTGTTPTAAEKAAVCHLPSEQLKHSQAEDHAAAAENDYPAYYQARAPRVKAYTCSWTPAANADFKARARCKTAMNDPANAAATQAGCARLADKGCQWTDWVPDWTRLAHTDCSCGSGAQLTAADRLIRVLQTQTRDQCDKACYEDRYCQEFVLSMAGECTLYKSGCEHNNYDPTTESAAIRKGNLCLTPTPHVKKDYDGYQCSWKAEHNARRAIEREHCTEDIENRPAYAGKTWQDYNGF